MHIAILLTLGKTLSARKSGRGGIEQAQVARGKRRASGVWVAVPAVSHAQRWKRGQRVGLQSLHPMTQRWSMTDDRRMFNF